MIEIFLPIEPPTTTYQMKKVRVVNGKPVFYEPDDVKKVRQKYIAYLSEYIPKQKLSGPVSMKCVWAFMDKKHKHDDLELMTDKPDIDNVMKMLLDCMTQCGFWEDDKQVVKLDVCKMWVHEHPGIAIWLDEVK